METFSNGDPDLSWSKKKNTFYVNSPTSKTPNQCLSMLSDEYNIWKRERVEVKDEEDK